MGKYDAVGGLPLVRRGMDVRGALTAQNGTVLPVHHVNTEVVFAGSTGTNGTSPTGVGGLSLVWSLLGSAQGAGTWKAGAFMWFGRRWSVDHVANISSVTTLSVSPDKSGAAVFLSGAPRTLLATAIGNGWTGGIKTIGPLTATKDCIALLVVSYAEKKAGYPPLDGWEMLSGNYPAGTSDAWGVFAKPFSAGSVVQQALADATYSTAAVLALIG